jgi:hypothetical protein
MSKGLLLESATCDRCRARMTIFLGVGRLGMFPRQVFVSDSHRGCYKCAACERYFCWDCSDSRKPCSCGQQRWLERQYFPEGVTPEQALAALL